MINIKRIFKVNNEKIILPKKILSSKILSSKMLYGKKKYEFSLHKNKKINLNINKSPVFLLFSLLFPLLFINYTESNAYEKKDKSSNQNNKIEKNIKENVVQNDFQQVLTIEKCYELARKNYPYIKKYKVVQKTSEFNITNAKMGYIPKFNFIAQASYQSDVTKMPFKHPMFQFEELSKDQYKIALDFNMPIWDGGKIAADISKIKAETEVEKDSIEVTLYSIKERINQVYFGILLLKEQIAQIDLYLEDLIRTENRISNNIKGGIGMISDIDTVKLEILKAKQNKVQLEYATTTYLLILENLIGEKISGKLIMPEAKMPEDENNLRPEIKLFQSQINLLESNKKAITSTYMPRFNLFAQAGYGRPGFDMLVNEFAPFFIGGINLQWTLTGFYTGSRSKKILDINKTAVEIEKETFLFNINQDLEKQSNEIKRIKDILKFDKDIIKLRSDIRKTSEKKMDEGIITINDYMRDVTEELNAKQNHILHNIELKNAIYNYKNILNQ